jgi:two-component system, NtrC family, sensor kinase
MIVGKSAGEDGAMNLNIRQKVGLVFAASIVVIALIAGYSYYYLKAIELKQHVVEVANDLQEMILEIRRYEKNYLLYGSEEDLQLNLRQIDLALKTLAQIMPEGSNLKIAKDLKSLEAELLAYKHLMQQIPTGRPRPQVSAEQEDEMRERGKRLVELSGQLVAFERQRILEIISSLKTQLLISTILFIICGILLTALVSRKIIRPLKVIQGTTERIAQGDFRPLPVLNTRDETQNVVEAFNRMVKELARRQDQLVQSKKMSSLGILTAGIAHQLNNPLNNISTSCQIVMEELDEGDKDLLRKMLGNIEQEVHRARDIVKGLLEFARARDFAIHDVPLSEVVKRAIRLISSQVPPGIEIIDQVPEDLIVHIDPQRMQEVFLNLFMNAIQAITEPPGQIRIGAKVDETNQNALISIEDTGMGIPKEALDHIFDPFFTLKEEGVGTGLGLSIVYGIVEKHRGSIMVESTEGKGTRFLIRIPRPTGQNSRQAA